MPGRQVLQSTFDAIVREAMTEFGMSAEEAVEDAREQLSKAGVSDFSNLVDPTAAGSAETRDMAESISGELRVALERQASVAELVQLLEKFVDGSHELIAVAGANGAVDVAIAALGRGVDDVGSGDWTVADAACGAVAALCDRNEANRTRFSSSKEADGVNLLKQLLEASVVVATEAAARTTHVLKAVSAVQRRSEPVKRRVAADGSLDTLLRVLGEAGRRIGNDKDSLHLFRQACFVLRQSLAPDDAAVAVAETFNRARIVAGGGSVTESGLRPLSIDDSLPRILHRVAICVRDATELDEGGRVCVLSDCVSLARLCAISDEICLDLHGLGFEDLAVGLLKEKAEVAGVVQSCIGLLRNLAGRDSVKTGLFSRMEEMMPVVVQHLESSAAITEWWLGLIASLCLRRADISRKCARGGVLDVVVEGMRKHEGKKGVQRMGCVAVRNACCRDVEARRRLREGGVAEKTVRKAWKTFPRECDELAYAALRDLDVLADEELRRDDRYTMPAGFFSVKPSKVKESGIGFDDMERGW